MISVKHREISLIVAATAVVLLSGCAAREPLSIDEKYAIQQVDVASSGSFSESATSTSLAGMTSTRVENSETAPAAAYSASSKESSLVETRSTTTSGTLLSVSVSRLVVTHGDTFTISIEATDSDGVKQVGFWLEVNGSQRDFCSQSAEMTSGSAENGVWSRDCVVPAAVIGGVYTVHPYALDSLYNETFSNSRATFTVDGGTSDNTGPNISRVVVSKTAVLPGDTFTISIYADDTSGVSRVGFWFALDRAQRNDFCGQSTSQTAGTNTDGVWEYQCTVPASTPTGSYTVFPYAMDTVLNWTNNNCCTTSNSFATFTVTS
jgi:hypothetical protein